MIKLTVAVAAAILAASAASAADIPGRSPSLTSSILAGYPASSGFYFGLNTMMGAGSVTADTVNPVAGVNSNSLTTTEGKIGGTIGYAWGTPNAFFAIEAMFDAANFNGSQQGLSLGGPASFEQRFKIGTPINNLLNLLPTLNLPTVAPFPALPAGVTATNVRPYLMGSIHEDDVSLAYLQSSGKEWQIGYGVGIGAIMQLTNGVAVDVWSEVVFGAQTVCVGPLACIHQNDKVMAGVGLYY